MVSKDHSTGWMVNSWGLPNTWHRASDGGGWPLQVSVAVNTGWRAHTSPPAILRCRREEVVSWLIDEWELTQCKPKAWQWTLVNPVFAQSPELVSCLAWVRVTADHSGSSSLPHSIKEKSHWPMGLMCSPGHSPGSGASCYNCQLGTNSRAIWDIWLTPHRDDGQRFSEGEKWGPRSTHVLLWD